MLPSVQIAGEYEKEKNNDLCRMMEEDMGVGEVDQVNKGCRERGGTFFSYASFERSGG